MATSLRNNERSGITGLMLFNGFNFLQCIEGERAAANDCMRRIERDDRHSGLTIVSHSKLARRQFTEWRMADQSMPAKSDSAADMLVILSHENVSEATRTLFQSFLSFGRKAAE